MIDCAMMRRLSFMIALIACLAWNGRASAQLTVTDWDLATGVQDLSIPTQDVDFTFTVANPLLLTQSAQLASGGTAATDYDFAWAGDDASFRVDMSHLTPDLGNDFYSSLSTGDIYFTTGVPLIARLTGSYTYFLPVARMQAAIGVNVRDIEQNQRLIFAEGIADTILSPAPQGGTFTWDKLALIPANRLYSISFDFQLRARRNTGEFATGSGSFTLTFEPVPEPATLMLSSVGTALYIRRSRRRPTRTTPNQASSTARHSVRPSD